MTPPPEPFFLRAEPGQRFCLYHAPDPTQPARGLVIFAPPFAEELNKSRRMAALQARAFAALGYGVVQLDLFGCGDSGGELSAARWDTWKRDLAHACEWGLAQQDRPLILWGLRLGALLVLDYVMHSAQPVDALLLWQPVISGEAHVRQFLRLQDVQTALSSHASSPSEVAGYTLSDRLQADIRAVDAHYLRPRCPVIWLELAATAMLPQPSARLIEQWRQDGASVQTSVLSGPHFWATTEITDCPDLLQATLRAVQQPGWLS